MYININGIGFNTKLPLEIFSNNTFGFDVTIFYYPNDWNHTRQDYHNITEVHTDYDKNGAIALESNIHCTGSTKWTSHNIKLVRITNSKKKYNWI